MASNQSSAMILIREMILRDQLAAGQTVTEQSLSEQLGMSRTPIRQALPALAEEGLLKKEGRSYVVRGYALKEIAQALDVLGCLEGIAARELAERGASRAEIRQLQECLQSGDEIFAGTTMTDEIKTLYGDMNGRFHELILQTSENTVVLGLVARLARIPFVSPRAVAFTPEGGAEMIQMLWYAHMQHHAIVDAIVRGESARLDHLLREHAKAKLDSVRLVSARASVPTRKDGPRPTIGGTLPPTFFK